MLRRYVTTPIWHWTFWGTKGKFDTSSHYIILFPGFLSREITHVNVKIWNKYVFNKQTWYWCGDRVRDPYHLATALMVPPLKGFLLYGVLTNVLYCKQRLWFRVNYYPFHGHKLVLYWINLGKNKCHRLKWAWEGNQNEGKYEVY